MIHSIFQNVHKTNEISIILECRIDVIKNNSMLAMPSRYEIAPNRDPVLQDQKVFELIWNLRLLHVQLFTIKHSKNTIRNIFRTIF